MAAHTEYRSSVDMVVPVSRIARAVAVGLLLCAVVATAGAVGYVYGRGHRRSEADIARQRDVAVRAAVARAVAAKGAADHVKRLKIVARHVAEQRSIDEALLQRMVLAEQRAGDERAAAAYQRGLAAGGRSGRGHRSRASARVAGPRSNRALSVGASQPGTVPLAAPPQR
jgi:hypothetical protein